MGKGAGCFPSKPLSAEQPATASQVRPSEPVNQNTPVQTETSAEIKKDSSVVQIKDISSEKMTKIYVVFYSMYGHIYKMAQAVKEGLESVPGVEVELYQVAETLPAEVLEKMHAPPKPEVPVLNPKDLVNADGFMFGFPTRFGLMPAQMKAFFDATGGLWQSGALHMKPAGVFTSTSTLGGGQETTIMTSVAVLAHHGMIYVPTGYSYGGPLFDTQVARGGSSWGAGTLAGPDGSRQPSDVELGHAKHQGKQFAEVAKKLAQ